jgi:hypothetical protein
VGRDSERYTADLPFDKSEIFFISGLDTISVNQKSSAPNQNIENNPMQRKEPLEKQGSLAWMLKPKKTL